VQYEGEESERNVFYTGAAPNQQAIPAVDYLMKDEKVKRWVLAGTDYVYPRTTNKILEAYLKSKGVAQDDIMINYTPSGHSDWQTYTKNPKRVTNDPMEAHVIGFDMWVKAVEKVKSTDADKVIDALPGIEAKNLTGGTSKMLPNHHITKPVFIGEIKANGQFDVVWKTPGLVAGDAWSKELEGSKDLIGDWVGQKCGNYNPKTNKCLGSGS